MVGAPRAQSSLEGQRKINESGAIYQCSFRPSRCEPFVVDKYGSTTDENYDYVLNSEYKDHQWLGASMDGNSSDSKKFVVRFVILLKNFKF